MRFSRSLVLPLVCAAWLSSTVLRAQNQSSLPGTSPNSKASATDSQQPSSSSPKKLEQTFFAILRNGDAKQFLSYVPESGVNVGSQTQHLTKSEVESQLLHQRGLYCKLFDSSCIQAEIHLDDTSVHACSYRELLTKSQKVRTAATETTRNNVRQAILVAEVKNDKCAGIGLIDFIFNLHADGWKLFSIP